MAILTVKSTARFKVFTPAMLHMLVRAERFASSITVVDEVVVTSANDSAHGENSRHYKDEALDFRTHDLPSRDAKRKFRADLEAALGPQFRCLFESEGTPNEHIHAQVRKGQVYRRETL